jgi:vacuolar protein sorting-associated protein 13A/C
MLMFRFLYVRSVMFQGVMEGPDEFADGLSYGAKSLLGHVVGGAAGSVSLISSSLGELLSNLSFDEDYKKVSRGTFVIKKVPIILG